MSDANTTNSNKMGFYIFILVLIALLTLIDGLDSTIVNIAKDDIAEFFHVDESWESWIIIAYMLPTVGFIVLFGKLLQTRAIKNILIISVIIFAVTSFFCGVSKTIEMLVLFRFLQGASGAVMLSATPILVVRELPESKISVGMAVMAVITGIATTLGPTVGSLITTTDLGWHGIFLINIPICIVIVALIFFGFKEDKNVPCKDGRPDLSICICYAFATMSFVYVITAIKDVDGDNTTLMILIVLLALSLIAGYLVWRHCMNDNHQHRLFRSSLLRNKEVILTTLSFICTTITSSIITYLLPSYLGIALNVEKGTVGMYFAVSAVITIVCSVIAGEWCQKHGCKSITVTAIAFRIAFALIFLFIKPEWGIVPVFIGLALMGVSFGFSGTAQPTRIVQHAEKVDKEDASNVMLTGNYVGAALGVALCVIVLFITVPGAYGLEIDKYTPEMITSGMHWCAAFSILVNLVALACTLKVRNIIPHDEEEKEDATVNQ